LLQDHQEEMAEPDPFKTEHFAKSKKSSEVALKAMTQNFFKHCKKG